MKILKNVCTRFARRTASAVRMSAVAAFALAAGSVSAATTFSYTVSSQDNTAGTYSATGGKVTIGASSKVESKNSKYGYKLDGDSGAKYMKLSLNTALKSGDVITVTELCASTPSGSNYGVSAGTSAFSAVSTAYCTAKNTWESRSITVASGSALVGATTVYLFRSKGYSTYVASVTISSSSATATPVKVTTKKKFDVIVGTSGNTDLQTVLDNYKSYSGSDRVYIFIPNGTYKLTGNATITTSSTQTGYTYNESTGTTGSATTYAAGTYNNAMTQLRSSNISIIGQSTDGTVLYNIPTIPGISYTSTLEFRSGSNNYLQDFTLKNMYAGGAHDKGVAVAFYDRGTNTIMKNVSCWSNQDTYVSAATRCYYETCKFAGTVDFICGGGDIWFEQCDLIINNRSGNVIAAPRTAATETWGYVFNKCTISKASGASSVTNGNWNLGRPWGNSPAATYLYTKMNVTPSAAGWTNMSSGLVLRFHEYGSTNSSGSTLDLSSRSVSACSPASADNPVLTASQAANYTVANVVGNNGSWDPQSYAAQVAVTGVSLSGSKLSWDNSDYALCWFVFKDGVYYANVTTNYITLSKSGTYTVRAANAMGGLGDSSTAVAYTAATTTATTTWDFSEFTSNVVAAGNNYSTSYNGLTLVGNATSTYTNDVITTGGFRLNGTSSSNQRYIKYKPSVSGTMTVTYVSNNISATDRITAIGTSIVTGTNVSSSTSGVLAAGYTNGATAKTISAYLTAGTTYYIYLANGGQTIKKLQYTYTTSASAKSTGVSGFEEEEVVTAVNNVKSEDATTKVQKRIENGKLIITKGDKKYNYAGGRIE